MAFEFAKQRYQVFNVSLERMFRVTRALGKLYDYDEEDMDLVFDFNRMIESNKNSIQFDYRRFINTLLNLTPSCSDNILKCVWKTKPVNCSEIFSSRRTMFGFCCTFNYYKSLDHIFLTEDNKSSTIEPEYLSMVGYETGLSLVLQSEPADYYYPLNNMEGLNVLIYNPRDYPDTSSGGLVETLIPLQREVFLQIDSLTVEAVQMLQEYPRDLRGCVFSTEDTTSFDTSYYSYSDCLNECKMRSILALCECIPFYMSISKKLPFSTQLCTLSDIVCLNKYK
ncbi:pickpocket 24, partial [Carabus blaptoides fortunei]